MGKNHLFLTLKLFWIFCGCNGVGNRILQIQKILKRGGGMCQCWNRWWWLRWCVVRPVISTRNKDISKRGDALLNAPLDVFLKHPDTFLGKIRKNHKKLRVVRPTRVIWVRVQQLPTTRFQSRTIQSLVCWSIIGSTVVWNSKICSSNLGCDGLR